ncbi:MAG: hypothetical protein ACPHVN_06035, partial [Luminiphilus sp.]
FSECDAPLAGVEARQLRPSRRMIAVDLDYGFERLVSDTALVTFDCHEANQKMGGGEIRALRQRALAGLGRDIQLATVQRFKAFLEQPGQILLSMSHAGYPRVL